MLLGEVLVATDDEPATRGTSINPIRPRASLAARLPVEGPNGTHFIDAAEIRSVKADAHYTLVHDGLVHQRYFRWVPRRGYARRLVQAHKLHHATTSRQGGVSFGFVLARDPAALKRELKAQRARGVAVLRGALED